MRMRTVVCQLLLRTNYPFYASGALGGVAVSNSWLAIVSPVSVVNLSATPVPNSVRPGARSQASSRPDARQIRRRYRAPGKGSIRHLEKDPHQLGGQAEGQAEKPP